MIMVAVNICDTIGYDVETELYYLNARYYSPEWMRFISPDGFEYIEPENINGLNLYCYCKNNPVMCYDPSGCFWQSIWEEINKIFSVPFGYFVDLTYWEQKTDYDFFFGGIEAGIKNEKIIGNDTNGINFYVTVPDKWSEIWDYQVGIKINKGKFSYCYSFGTLEFTSSLKYGNHSLEVQVGCYEISIGNSMTHNDVTNYYRCYIRTIPTAAVVLAIIFAPEIALAIAPAIASAQGFIQQLSELFRQPSYA